VTGAIVQLAKEFDLYDSGIGPAKIAAALARVEAVRQQVATVDRHVRRTVELQPCLQDQRENQATSPTVPSPPHGSKVKST
jgi:hypothetical protein